MPDVILHGLDFKESGVPLLSGLADTDAVTVLELQDSWAVPDEQAEFINREQFDLGLLVVHHHIPFYSALCPDTEFLWTPHAVNTALFHDYGLEKDCDVLLYGNVTHHTYPFRARLADILSLSDLCFRWIEHPGYYPHGEGRFLRNGQRVTAKCAYTPTQSPQLIAGADLSREINRAWITVSTSSIYRCLMMKYFEIAASGSLIAGDMPDEGRDIFGDNFLELSPDESDAQILDSIKSCLADKDSLRQKTLSAQRRVLRDHNTDTFATRLLSQLQDFVQRRHSEQAAGQAVPDFHRRHQVLCRGGG